LIDHYSQCIVMCNVKQKPNVEQLTEFNTPTVGHRSTLWIKQLTTKKRNLFVLHAICAQVIWGLNFANHLDIHMDITVTFITVSLKGNLRSYTCTVWSYFIDRII